MQLQARKRLWWVGLHNVTICAHSQQGNPWAKFNFIVGLHYLNVTLTIQAE